MAAEGLEVAAGLEPGPIAQGLRLFGEGLRIVADGLVVSGRAVGRAKVLLLAV